MTRYEVLELDVNDKSLMLRSGLTQGEARAMLARLREAYGKFGLRYIMRRISLGQPSKPSHHATVLP